MNYHTPLSTNLIGCVHKRSVHRYAIHFLGLEGIFNIPTLTSIDLPVAENTIENSGINFYPVIYQVTRSGSDNVEN